MEEKDLTEVSKKNELKKSFSSLKDKNKKALSISDPKRVKIMDVESLKSSLSS